MLEFFFIFLYIKDNEKLKTQSKIGGGGVIQCKWELFISIYEGFIFGRLCILYLLYIIYLESIIYYIFYNYHILYIIYFLSIIHFIFILLCTHVEKKKQLCSQQKPHQVMTPCLVWFGFFFEWHIKLRGLFNTKAILLEEQQWCCLIHSWGDKGCSYLSHGYLSETEHNSMTGVWTHLLQFHSPTL